MEWSGVVEWWSGGVVEWWSPLPGPVLTAIKQLLFRREVAKLRAWYESYS